MYMTEIIKMRRKELGMTQKEFAEILDISDKTVSRWESGVQTPDVVLVPEIAGVLGITVNELYGISEGFGKDLSTDTVDSDDRTDMDQELNKRTINRKMITVYKIISVVAMVISVLGGIWLCVYDALRMEIEGGVANALYTTIEYDHTIQGTSGSVMSSGYNGARSIGYVLFFGGILILLGNQIWFLIYQRKKDRISVIYKSTAIQYCGLAFLLIFAMAGVLLPIWHGIPFTEAYAAIAIAAATVMQGSILYTFRFVQQRGVRFKRWIPITSGIITLMTVTGYAAWALHGLMTEMWAHDDGTLEYYSFAYSADRMQIVANIADMTHRMNYTAFIITCAVLLIPLIVVYIYLMKKLREIEIK